MQSFYRQHQNRSLHVMSNQDRPTLSKHDEESITVRDRDLSSEIMGEMDFGSSVYLVLTGEEPTEEEQRLFSAMLSSLMVHGMTPHAIAARLTYLSEPESIQGAVASGLAGVGSRFAGAMQECARDLQAVAEEEDADTAIKDLVAEYRDRGDAFPGIGHPHFDPIDPRAEKLFELAEDAEIIGPHTYALHNLQTAFEEEIGQNLPINVTGAIGAIASDMGLSPEGARGIAVISRAAGLVAEVLDEKEDLIAMDVWQYADGKRFEGE